MILIKNPYPTYCDPQAERSSAIHVHLPTSVKAYLCSVFPGHGNIQAVVNTLIQQFVEKLQKDGITRYDFENEFAIKAVLYGRNTDTKSAKRTATRHVGRGKESIRRGASKRQSKQQCASEPDRARSLAEDQQIIWGEGAQA